MRVSKICATDFDGRSREAPGRDAYQKQCCGQEIAAPEPTLLVFEITPIIIIFVF